MWEQKYLRIPFKEGGRDEKGADCAGLVMMIYRNELGIEVDESPVSYEDTSRHSAKLLDCATTEYFATMKGFREVPLTEIEPFDVLLFQIGGARSHIGICVRPNFMLHIVSKERACVDRYNGVVWGQRLVGAYRYVKDQ
jgi:cell wall-associated NlpC family hydrolase